MFLAHCLHVTSDFDLSASLGFCIGGGLGTQEEPYTVCQYPYFRDIRLRENWQNQHYLIGANIDARESWSENTNARGLSEECLFPFFGQDDDDDPDNLIGDCSGWRPFDLEGGAFNGGLDGRGHAIRNLFSNVRPKARALFTGVIFNNGHIGEGAYIRNLGFIDPMVQRGASYRGSMGRGFTSNTAVNTSILAPENRGYHR